MNNKLFNDCLYSSLGKLHSIHRGILSMIPSLAVLLMIYGPLINGESLEVVMLLTSLLAPHRTIDMQSIVL